MRLILDTAPAHLVQKLHGINRRAEWVYLPDSNRWAVMTRRRPGNDEQCFKLELVLPAMDRRTLREAKPRTPFQFLKRGDPCQAVLPAVKKHYDFRYLRGRRMLQAHDEEVLTAIRRHEAADRAETVRTGADAMAHARRKLERQGYDITPTCNVPKKLLRDSEGEQELREAMEIVAGDREPEHRTPMLEFPDHDHEGA